MATQVKSGDPGLELLSGVSGLAGSMANAFADISQGDYISKQFLLNEQLTQIQGKEAILQGQEEQQVSQERTAQLAGQQKASEAAQGVDVRTGTSAITTQQTGEIGAKDYLTLGNNAFLKSLGFQISGLNDTAQSNMAGSAGINKAANSLGGGFVDLYQSQMKAVAYDQQEKATILQDNNLLPPAPVTP